MPCSQAQTKTRGNPDRGTRRASSALTWAAPTTVQKHCPRKRHTLMAGSSTRTEGTAKPRAPLQCRIPCQACAASAFFCRPGSGAQSVGRRRHACALGAGRRLAARNRPGLDCHEFSSAPSHARMQTFGGRCSCTSSVRSTQTASSPQHSPQYSPRVRRSSPTSCSRVPGCEDGLRHAESLSPPRY